MTKFAKIISLFLCLAMVFSVAGAMVISSFAVDAPALAVKKVSQSGNTLVVDISLTKGTFNSMDVVFNMKGLECTGIDQGAVVGTSGAFMYGNPSAPAGKSHISMIAVNGMKTGSIATVTLKITKADDYSFSISVADCAVTDENNENISVNPTISGNSIVSEKPSSSSSSSSTTSTTKKTTTTTKKTTTTTTKKTTTTKPAPTSNVPTNTLPSSTEVPSSSDVSSSVEDTTPDFSYDYNDNDYDYYTPDDDETKPADSDELLDNEKDPKTIIIIAAVAVVLIAGAVVAFVVINKKKNAE